MIAWSSMHRFHDDHIIHLRAKSRLRNPFLCLWSSYCPIYPCAQTVVSSRFVQGLGFLCLPCAVSSIVILKLALHT